LNYKVLSNIKNENMITKKQTSSFIFAVLMLAAFFANLYADGWNWSPSDFLVAGILLFGAAFFVHLVLSSGRSLSSKLIISMIILLALALIWIELAVGIFASPFAGS